MSQHHEKLKQHAAAWILKALYTNDLWFDELRTKKSVQKNYLFVPLFDIAESSKRFDFSTLKETCYLLQQNNHIHIWGDDYDPRAMLVQISEQGINAYKKSFYARDYRSMFKKSLAIAAVATAIFMTVKITNKYYQESKRPIYHSVSNVGNLSKTASQKTAASLK